MDYKKENSHGNLMSYRQSNGASTTMSAFSITLTKKCERLATAIYLVTNFLSDSEPMKARLRVLSLDFVRDASLLKNGSYGVEANVLEALRSNILDTLSLLELAFVAGLVSEMNFTILKREYTSLHDTIEVKKASRESRTDTVLGDTFFGSSFHAEENISTTVSHPRSDLKNPSPRSDLYASTHRISIGHNEKQMSDRKLENNVLEKPNSIPKTVGQLSDTVTHTRALTNVQKESRRARILKLVKDNREVTIKDIANHFPDLSEKTIQRELVTLVETNVLKKFGERRWSRYALV